MGSALCDLVVGIIFISGIGGIDMATQIIHYRLPTGDRECKRISLIHCFLTEKPGTGNGKDSSRYQYNVETYGNYGIFLKRPTWLNKGFDFTVNIQGLYFKKNKRYSNPSHQDIFDALTYCQSISPSEYDQVKSAVVDIYNCRDIDMSHIHASFCDFAGVSHPIQIILLAIKWLFMEQDCAYWNYSGRMMFYHGLGEKNLV